MVIKYHQIRKKAVLLIYTPISFFTRSIFHFHKRNRPEKGISGEKQRKILKLRYFSGKLPNRDIQAGKTAAETKKMLYQILDKALTGSGKDLPGIFHGIDLFIQIPKDLQKNKDLLLRVFLQEFPHGHSEKPDPLIQMPHSFRRKGDSYRTAVLFILFPFQKTVFHKMIHNDTCGSGSEIHFGNKIFKHHTAFRIFFPESGDRFHHPQLSDGDSGDLFLIAFVVSAGIFPEFIHDPKKKFDRFFCLFHGYLPSY